MEDENKEEPVSEVQEESTDESQQEEKRQVPLEALQAERRKRQEAEQNMHTYQELIKRMDAERNQKAQEPDEDDEDLVSKRDLKAFQKNLTTEQFFALKREIAEETFKETNPQAIRDINSSLKQILEQKPWLADSIEKATNRYARAYEIVQDYKPLLSGKSIQKDAGAKVIENAKKPGSPASTAKSSQLTGADYLKSIAGTSDFREYRNKLLGR